MVIVQLEKRFSNWHPSRWKQSFEVFLESLKFILHKLILLGQTTDLIYLISFHVLLNLVELHKLFILFLNYRLLLLHLHHCELRKEILFECLVVKRSISILKHFVPQQIRNNVLIFITYPVDKQLNLENIINANLIPVSREVKSWKSSFRFSVQLLHR